MTNLDLTRAEWRDPRLLRTHRGKLVYRAADGTGFAQEEADLAPKNLVIVRNRPSGWQLVHLHDGEAQLPAPEVIAAALGDPARSTAIDGVTVEPAPGLDTFGLRLDGLYLSADRETEVRFAATRRQAWEIFEATTPGMLEYGLWRPPATMGGTQLMLHGLAERLGGELDAINLQLHQPDRNPLDTRPLVVWLHNVVSGRFGWCGREQETERVAAFVFVSHWQRQQYLSRFPSLPAERCHVICNATNTDAPIRPWPAEKPWRWRCAYISAPDRGLTVLLDAWERLDRADAELHIWSSFRLWGPSFSDSGYNAVFARARRLPGVTYHGIRPNAEVRAALRDMHFLTYPATFNETACLAVMEAMAAGVRVVTTARAALPETTSGFAHLYNPAGNHAARVEAFTREMAAEFGDPWGGHPETAAAAQAFARETYGWPRCLEAWRGLIAQLTR